MHSAAARETNAISQWQEIFAPRRWHRCWFHAGEKIVGEFQQWGLPGFRGRQQIINARAETVTEKPMFRRSIAFQRCVIPATGFYEWDAAKHKYKNKLQHSIAFAKNYKPAIFCSGSQPLHLLSIS